ncbi:signal transduction histidine kinase [Rhodobium orientis]|uniref:histidine kinase n=1 Tax=Rhodobium orientis TaxID=34017 RepID=A0A327JF94_9HYPH|nr:PAS domain-containing sensor histidine kinase [Rhodobium orientis]MBB4303572.1 signal transduction histidine kinase [Rhodobium orientis]MBK5950501.1 two-component sensor histidine kinase [Rhodobium orientis]RAI24259.1 two-component sensor histidine kinase [Rhodobium orientis]
MPKHGGRRRGNSSRQSGSPHPALKALPLVPFLLPATAARAQDLPQRFPTQLGSLEVLWMVSLVGAFVFAVFSAVILIRNRRRAEEDIARLERGIADFQASVEQAEALLDTDDQRNVIWHRSTGKPTVIGSLGGGSGAPESPAAFLAFGTWLTPDSATRLEHALADLRNEGESFAFNLTSTGGGLVEAVGRTASGRAIARFRDLTGERQTHALMVAEHEKLTSMVETMRALLDAMPNPCWIRNPDGSFLWVNEAYAEAVEAPNQIQAARGGNELLDGAARKLMEGHHATDPVFHKRLPVVVAGDRKLFDVLDVAGDDGQAGIAIDVSELEKMQADLRRTLDFHARTLDELATAVAIFGADRRLTFYNAAYRDLWGLDPAFLESAPEDSAILDRLRQDRKLPEQADFRAWKKSILDAYREVGAIEHWWHLPDGRTVRVVANPHPQGGVTYVYENVTEKLDLESRYNALIRVQRETLDNLQEGVAVFGSNGRLRLWNPSIVAIWSLDETTLEDRPHIAQVIKQCRRIHDDAPTWQRLNATVAGFAETRTPIAGRMERGDGTVVDYATLPLPDGATLVTFVDVTDTVHVERALVDKNEALQQADELKNTFIQHVSYELRSPLTNIIGFAQLLNDPKFGELNDKQQEYTDYIRSSSAALLAIINDILDLATLDAGIMELHLGEVDIGETATAAIEGLQDRIRESEIRITTDIPDDIGHFTADEKRIRQVLYNLLSNAIVYSDHGGLVEIIARRSGEGVSLTVRDHGCGIPQDFMPNVFDRFVSRTTGNRRRGPGLGLAIVKSFVEAHRGVVDIASREGEGTTVTCLFPFEPAPGHGDATPASIAAPDGRGENGVPAAGAGRS